MEHLGGLRTPAFVVDKAQVRKNCQRARDTAAARGLRLRPNVKTHKTVEGVRCQMEGIASPNRGVVASTLGEVRAFAKADGGKLLDEILYSTPMSDPGKLEEIAELAKEGPTIMIMLDSLAQLEIVEREAALLGVQFPAFMKVDCGYHRAGIDSRSEGAVGLAQRIAQGKHTSLRGLYSHSGDGYALQGKEALDELARKEGQQLVDLAAKMREAGVDVPNISAGSTPTCLLGSEGFPEGVTEMHPGNYVLFDLQQESVGACREDEIAGWVVSRVVAHYPERGTLLIDAGSLALSKDTAPNTPGSFGRIVGQPDLRVSRVSQEMAVVVAAEGHTIPYADLPLGSLVAILPAHSCLAAGCYDTLHVTESGLGSKVVETWQTARGW